MACDNLKQFFHQWCDKHSITPQFDVRTVGKLSYLLEKSTLYLFFFLNCLCLVGRKQAPRFLCEVRVPGYPYIGVGNSTTKKEAQFNAAKDFIQFLVRQGKIDEKELPTDVSVSNRTVNFFSKLHKN